MLAPWFTGGFGVSCLSQTVDNEEKMNKDEAAVVVDVTVFGDQFVESCFSGG
jgi:hypothetical protein